MIKIEVVSEEKNWSKKIKKKEFFFKSICKSFPKKYRVMNKKLSLTLLLSNNKSIKKLTVFSNLYVKLFPKNISF